MTRSKRLLCHVLILSIVHTIIGVGFLLMAFHFQSMIGGIASTGYLCWNGFITHSACSVLPPTE
jgi:hypothetical protein